MPYNAAIGINRIREDISAILQRRDLRVEPVGQRRQLLRVFQLCLLFFGQGFIISFAGGLKRLVDRHGILIVHAVQFRRVRQSVDHRLHGGHGLVLLCGRILLLFFLFRRLALLLRFRRLALLLRFRRLIFLLHFPVCRVCRFLHGRGRLRRPLRLLRQRRRGQQRQAQGQRHETTQDTLLHRSPPVRFLLCPNQSPTDRDLPVGSPPYGSGGRPPDSFSVFGVQCSIFSAPCGAVCMKRPQFDMKCHRSGHLHPTSFFTIRSYTVHRCTMQELF